MLILYAISMSSRVHSDLYTSAGLLAAAAASIQRFFCLVQVKLGTAEFTSELRQEMEQRLFLCDFYVMLVSPVQFCNLAAMKFLE